MSKQICLLETLCVLVGHYTRKNQTVKTVFVLTQVPTPAPSWRITQEPPSPMTPTPSRQRPLVPPHHRMKLSTPRCVFLIPPQKPSQDPPQPPCRRVWVSGLGQSLGKCTMASQAWGRHLGHRLPRLPLTHLLSTVWRRPLRNSHNMQ